MAAAIVILASRPMAALEGAVAHLTQATDAGGFLDIPLAFAALAAKRSLSNLATPDKSFYFLGGLTEASETLLCFMAMCLWPGPFIELAHGFATLCAFTTAARIWWGWKEFQ